jgi:predicted DNA-binding helix-hairpin-helix protein
MKNLVIPVKSIPGTTRIQTVAEAIELAQEMDVMIELDTENTKVHILPDSKQEQVEGQLQEKTGK